MALLAAGLVLFLGVHSLQIARPLRDGTVGLTGEAAYKILYSLLALGGLILIAEGYKAWRFAGSPVLYAPPVWLSHVSLLLMLPAFVLLAATYTKGHIRRAVRHPMITAVKVWALAHLLANGDAASVALFGAFLAWGVADRISVKRRERAGLIRPAAFEPRVSQDLVAVAIGLGVYVLFVWRLHLWLIGVSPIGT